MPQPSRSSFRPYLHSIKARGLRKNFEGIIRFARPSNNVFETASLKNIKNFGNVFLGSFPARTIQQEVRLQISSAEHESPIAASLSFLHNGTKYIFREKLGFEKDAVVVEGIQGPLNAEIAADILNSKLGVHWPNFLLHEIELHAKGLGFLAVKIRVPKQGYNFTGASKANNLSSMEVVTIKKRLDFFKKRISQGKLINFSKEELKILKLKGLLSLQKSKPPKDWNDVYFAFCDFYSEKKFHSEIESFVSFIAKNNGYKKAGDFFIKSL
mgnify:CR=1 FL=1